MAESSALVDVDVNRVQVVRPDFAFPADGVHIRWPDDRLQAEKRLLTVKLEAAKAFARVNAIDKLVWNPPQAKFGLVAAGKAYLDLRQALADMGVDEQAAERLGIRLYKVGLVWPIEEHGMQRFCDGLDRIFVVEEKRSVLENQIVMQLFRQHATTQVLGKNDADGAELLPNYGETTPVMLVEALVRALPALAEMPSVAARRAVLQAQQSSRAALPKVAERSAFFCSGCPHNSSTKVPEGSLALAGIGCHWLSLFMDRQTETFTQMGGEGVTWLGMMPFTERKHVFVNLGDGTYHHSGILAIRAAIYAKANVTYKVLFNDAVAMTGGQMVSDTYTPQQIVQQIVAEGIGRAIVVSDDIEKYKSISRWQRRLSGRRDDPSPRRAGSAATRNAQRAWRHAAAVRPDLRGGKAPPAQARQDGRPRHARLHQRRGLRRLRRLFGAEQLHLGRAGWRHRSGASARSTKARATRTFPA